MCKFVSLGGLFFALILRANAQTAPVAPVPSLSANITQWALPSLDTVLALARAHAPSVKLQKAMTERGSYFIKNQKQLWLDGIGVDLQLASSNQALLVQQATGDLEAFQNYNSGLRASLNVRLSLYTLFGRKNLLRMADADFEAAKQRTNYAYQEIETIVISRYYAVQAAQAMLRIKEETKQITKMSRQMAEKDFSQGNISVTELARLVQISTFTEAEYETARQNFYENLKTLEVLTGHEFFPKI